ncbi:hypothetical protein [Prevotella sp. oral taxon 820]|uniref:hypothetical protein n=1 Tax=Prevotella sp. oral taxon 820 TaxID=2081962 RepID=UPI0013048C54|nr:hypothetical protein [Prevotella sp. oral taxon 820]
MKEVVFTKAKSFILVFTQNQNFLHDKGMLLQAAGLFRTVPIAPIGKQNGAVEN